MAAIATKYALSKKQVTRQLKSYKDKKYRMKDIIFEFSLERLIGISAMVGDIQTLNFIDWRYRVPYVKQLTLGGPAQ